MSVYLELNNDISNSNYCLYDDKAGGRTGKCSFLSALRAQI